MTSITSVSIAALYTDKSTTDSSSTLTTDEAAAKAAEAAAAKAAAQLAADQKAKDSAAVIQNAQQTVATDQTAVIKADAKVLTDEEASAGLDTTV